jgi:thiamine-monophosphate kinase
MSSGEFDLIERYFKRSADKSDPFLGLGIGDDCAILQPSANTQWAVSTDMLVEGRHFLSTVAPDRLGHKALAVNLSDLAACGACPRVFFLALSMVRPDESFLQGFAKGMFALADAMQMTLAGGDTTAGPLSVCITVMGELKSGQALRRDAAQPGDELWVSHPIAGGIGDARLALEAFRGKLSLTQADFEYTRDRLELPIPRVELGLALQGISRCAIDLSDGLVGDLQHVLRASRVGAEIELAQLPRSAAMQRQSLECQHQCLLEGGDDYELLFTAPPRHQSAIINKAAELGLAVTCIGRITRDSSLQIRDEQGRALSTCYASFDHFRA